MVNTLKVGDKAPDFDLPDEENRIRCLKEFLGQKVALVFFIGAFTFTSTKERCEFRDSMAQLINLKAQIVGIDVKAPSVNKSLVEKNRLTFPVLSDCERKVFTEYGLEVSDLVGSNGESLACRWGDSCYSTANPSIFILDENGVIRYIWSSKKNTLEPDYEEIKKVLKHIALEKSLTRTHHVITISRQAGSGGDEIASKISEILGYAYFDKNLMVRAARAIGISEEEIADFSEDTYRITNFVERIFRGKRSVLSSLDYNVTDSVRKNLDEEKCLSVIQTIINNLASRQKTVIVGRGGQAILKNKVGALHVRIVAPKSVRIERVMANHKLSYDEASKLIEGNDKAAAEYLHRFYCIDWDDPLMYDVILNTGKLDLNMAARMIALAASQPW